MIFLFLRNNGIVITKCIKICYLLLDAFGVSLNYIAEFYNISQISQWIFSFQHVSHCCEKL